MKKENYETLIQNLYPQNYETLFRIFQKSYFEEVWTISLALLTIPCAKLEGSVTTHCPFTSEMATMKPPNTVLMIKLYIV